MKKYGSAKQALFDVGIDLLLEHGYEKLSVAQICQQSQTSNGSFFHHFGSKRNFVAQLYLQTLAAYQGAIIALFTDKPSIIQGIELLIRNHYQWVAEYPKQATLLLSPPGAEVFDADQDAIRQQNKSFYRAYVSWLEQQLATEQREPISPEVFYFQVLGPVQMHCRTWLASNTKNSPEDELARYISLAQSAFK